MNNKIKVIFVSSVSASLFLNSGRGDINKLTKENWHSLTAIEIKKRNPCLEIECWSPEIKYKKEKKFKELGIKYCIFPSDLVIRPGMEVCLRMVHKLNSEIKKSQENNQKLIIHLHEYHSWQIYLILLLLKRKKNVKIIAQHHGGRNPFANLRKYKRLALFLPLISLMQFFEHLLFKKVDVFYALGDLEINYLKKIAPNSEIRFQSVGIEEEYFKVVDKTAARKKLNLNLDKKYALFIGRIKATKGIRELLDAARALKEVKFIILGNGEDFKIFNDYAKKYKIDNVQFLGAIYGIEKLDYISASDCLILPSHTEGAPVVLMEAIARNIPVIATNVGGIPNMIQNGREGILIFPKSEREIIKSLKKILKWESKSISQYANKYRWDNIVKKTYEDYIKC